MAGVQFVHDDALAALSSGTHFSQLGFHENAREKFEEALRLDPLVLERSPSPQECWLYCAKVYAETDTELAQEAFNRAIEIEPGIRRLIDPTWKLSGLLAEGDHEAQ